MTGRRAGAETAEGGVVTRAALSRMVLGRVAAALLVACLAGGACSAQAQTGAAARAKEDPAKWRAALDGVSPEEMKKHLSYIASDELQGRKTPSKGLDLAAEYIAAQFRRAGLEPAGDDGYFQTVKWADVAATSPHVAVWK